MAISRVVLHRRMVRLIFMVLIANGSGFMFRPRAALNRWRRSKSRNGQQQRIGTSLKPSIPRSQLTTGRQDTERDQRAVVIAESAADDQQLVDARSDEEKKHEDEEGVSQEVKEESEVENNEEKKQPETVAASGVDSEDPTYQLSPDGDSAVEVTASTSTLDQTVDKSEIGKYFMATISQFVLMAATLAFLDARGALRGLHLTLPPWAVGVLFAFLSIRSRVFSFMDISRVRATRLDPRRPKWTPKGNYVTTFWMTTTALRAAASTLVYCANGRRLFSLPLLGLAAHISVVSTYETITNFEKRLGVGTIASLAKALSIYGTVWLFMRVDRIAGLVLAPTAVWLSVLSILTAHIWYINEPRQPLVPLNEDGKASKWGIDYTFIGYLIQPFRFAVRMAQNIGTEEKADAGGEVGL